MSESTLMQRIQEFVRVTPHTKSYSKATVLIYGHWLRNFARWVGTEAALTDFCEDKLRAYRNAKLTEKDYSRTTLCSMYASFHAFSAWLQSEGLLQHDPADILGKVKPQPPKHDNLISDAEAFGMIDACARYSDSYRETLARAILCTAVHGGLRRGDLLKLETTDVFLHDGFVRLRFGKGGKKRDAYLCPEAIDALTNYIAARPKPCQSTRLFVLNQRFPVSLGTLNAIMRETWAMAGYNKQRRVTIHSFRHCWVTRLLNNGADISSVAKLAGHSNAAITSQIYHNPQSAHLRAVAALSARPTPTPPPAPPPSDKANQMPDLYLTFEQDESA